MAPFRFAILLSEILFVIRTLHVFRDRALVSERVVTITGTLALASIAGGPIWFIREDVWPIILSLIVTGTPLTLFLLGERQQLMNFRARVPLFLDRWILNMRVGHALNTAREAALREESLRFQSLLRPVFETRGGERTGHLLLSPLARRELENISLSTHAALPRLENLRAMVRKTSDFRRKSGQAAQQTAIQSLVMLILLLALSLYTIWRYGWTHSAGFVGAAALLSMIGVWLMRRLARKTRWKF